MNGLVLLRELTDCVFQPAGPSLPMRQVLSYKLQSGLLPSQGHTQMTEVACDKLSSLRHTKNYFPVLLVAYLLNIYTR